MSQIEGKGERKKKQCKKQTQSHVARDREKFECVTDTVERGTKGQVLGSGKVHKEGVEKVQEKKSSTGKARRTSRRSTLGWVKKVCGERH